MTTILIVDDNEQNLYMLRALLEGHGYIVVSATNGAETLETARRDPPDMIVSDVLMPVMDGFTLCRHWRADARLKKIPFVFYSATYVDPKDSELALRLGAARYIRKPVEPDVLLGALEKVLSDADTTRTKPEEPIQEQEQEQEVLKLYSERLVSMLERKMAALQEEAAERKRAEAAVEHLNRVLRSIRSVSRLIVREKDPQRLIDQACRDLVRTRGYGAAWIATFDDTRASVLTAAEGYGDVFAEMNRFLQAGRLPGCGDAALARPDVVIVTDPRSTCADCPLTHAISEHGSFTVRLENKGKIYGLMSVNLPLQFVGDKEEISLFSEMAGDIAFALRDIDIERQREKLMHNMEERAKELRGLYEMSRATIASASMGELLERTCSLIPPAWHYPEITRARVVFDGHEHCSEPSQPTRWKQAADILVEGKTRGAIEVHYLEERPELDEGPFLAEERALINGLAEMLGTAATRMNAKEALQESESRYAETISNINDIVWRYEADEQGKFVSSYISPVADRLLGLPDGDIGHSFDRFFSHVVPDDLPAVKETLASALTAMDEKIFVEYRLRESGGGVLWVRSHGTAQRQPNGNAIAYGVTTDITERKQMHAQLAQSDRLSSMGMLAAGVAHEINNPLAYILYNLESLSDDLPSLLDSMRDYQARVNDRYGPDSVEETVGHAAKGMNPAMWIDIQERFRDALEGTRRIRDIARGLGTFSRVEKDQLVPVNLMHVIEAALNMCFNEIKYRARMVKDYGKVPTVTASEGRLSQVFLNLFVNAAHAIDEGDMEGNEIRVRTWTEGEMVCAEVRDTGKGIAPEHIGHLFEPFFTTKEVGVGSGLGLPISKGIVEGYGGTITVESEVDKGTAFLVRIPVRAEEVAPTPTVEPAEKREQVRGRILIVDDEDPIRTAMVRILRLHETMQASNGEVAKQILEQDQNFDLILCDMMMPKVSGMDLHAWLSKENPRLARQIVFITGGAFTSRAREFLKQVDNIRLEKPFDVTNLRKIVGELIVAGRRKGS